VVVLAVVTAVMTGAMIAVATNGAPTTSISMMRFHSNE
jgi:hypothetical protein